MTSIETRVRANLLAARKQGKLKQSDVGEMLGVTAQSVWNWEKGRQFPAPEKLEKLAQALGLGDGTWFFEDHGNVPPSKDAETVEVSREIWRVCVPLYQAYSKINPTAPRLPKALKVFCSPQNASLMAPYPGLDMLALSQFAQLGLSA